MGLAEVLATDVGQWWVDRMKSTGITQKHAPAHMQRNCGIFAKMEGKKEAHRAATLYARKGFTVRDNKLRHSLMLCGGVGTGKTWLGTAAFKHVLYNLEIRNHHRGHRTAYWRTFAGIVRHVQSTYSDPGVSSDSVLAMYQRCHLLFIDDFGDMESGTTDDKRSITFEIMDWRNSNSLPTIITTNLELGEMREKWGSRLFDRIAEMSSIVTMGGKNLRHEDMGKLQEIEDAERVYSMARDDVKLRPIPIRPDLNVDTCNHESEEFPF